MACSGEGMVVVPTACYDGRLRTIHVGLSSTRATAHQAARAVCRRRGQEATFEATGTVWNGPCDRSHGCPRPRVAGLCDTKPRSKAPRAGESERGAAAGTVRCRICQPHYSEQFLRSTAHPYLQRHSSLAWRQQWTQDGGDAARPQIGSSAARDAAAAIRADRQQR